MVHPEKQIWHCFGCSKGGDIFSFVQEIESMDFPEALKFLADKAGVKLENNFQSEVQKSQKNRILEINSKAAYFFHRFLLDIPGAKSARDYLDRRVLKKETIEKWQVGFIPEQWDLLTQYLLKKGYGIEDLVAAGLTIKRDGADAKTGRGYYDRFRGRIMFPLSDAHGNVVGFTGRILVETENSGGKYVNTPQTPVYDKSRVLFGLDKAKNEIKAKDLAVIVEGQMDVIACHQTGLTNVVAASGTALTFEQIKLLKRYSNNIAMAFDADAAGQNAAKRGIDIALQEGMNVRVIQIPEGAGKDADECLKKNPKIWFAAVNQAKSVMDWYFQNILNKINLSDPRQKQRAVDDLLNEIIKIPYPVERDSWMKKLAEAVNIDVTVIAESAKKRVTQTKSTNKNTDSESARLPLANDRYHLLLEGLWSLFIKFPNLFGAFNSFLQPDFFIDHPTAALYEMAQKQYNNGQRIDINELHALHLGVSENLVDILLLKAEKDFLDYTEEMGAKEVELLLAETIKLWKKKRKDLLAQELKQVQQIANKERENEILTEIMKLK
jgi:DNA primase